MNIQSQPRHTMDRREQILQATANLIAECGLQASPMSKVAKSACCGAGTIYRYFETKEDLVRELYKELTTQMNQACLQDYDRAACIKVRFYTIWGNFYRHMSSNPRDCALMEQLSASPAICCHFKDEAMEPLRQEVDQLIDEGKQQQLFKELPNETLAMFTFGSLASIAKKQHNMAEQCRPANVYETQNLLNLCWDAVKA